MEPSAVDPHISDRFWLLISGLFGIFTRILVKDELNRKQAAAGIVGGVGLTYFGIPFAAEYLHLSQAASNAAAFVAGLVAANIIGGVLASASRLEGVLPDFVVKQLERFK